MNGKTVVLDASVLTRTADEWKREEYAIGFYGTDSRAQADGHCPGHQDYARPLAEFKFTCAWGAIGRTLGLNAREVEAFRSRLRRRRFAAMTSLDTLSSISNVKGHSAAVKKMREIAVLMDDPIVIEIPS